MEPPLWLFQRDEIDVLETEIDHLWDLYVGRHKADGEEGRVLKEYADSEAWAETDVLLRIGPPQDTPCSHAEEHQRHMEELPLGHVLRQGLQRDVLYAQTYAWSRKMADWVETRAASYGGAYDLFRVYVNVLLVPVKLAFALSGEAHEGRYAQEMALSDFGLALLYLSRAAESLRRLGATDQAREADQLSQAILARRTRLNGSSYA